jgi:MscS family membrane protein
MAVAWRAVISLVLAMACHWALAQGPASDALQGASGTAAPTADPYGRETPRGLATGLLGAFASGDYRRAGHYLEAPSGRAKASPEAMAELAQQLQRKLDAGGSLRPFATLSNDAAGDTDDGLPIDQEQIGTLRTETGELALLARRVAPDDTAAHWVVSAESMKSVARLQVEAEMTPPTTRLPAALSATSVAGAPVADWVVLAGIGLVSFLGMRMLFAVVLKLVRVFVAHPATHRGYQFVEAAFPPLSLYLAVVVFFVTTEELQVAIVARQALARYATIVGWIAFVWLLWRLIDMAADLWAARMARSDRRQAIAALTFTRRSAKTLLAVAAFVAVLDTMDINVTTGIAALGLGGLAIALGAQKSIENLVGSLSVILDQPVQVGDFCKVGDVLGTVEDIGMRSTRLRTIERTVVTIPNGSFAAQQIENYSRRDRFLVHPVLGVTYDANAAQLAALLAGLRAVLSEDPHIEQGARVNFIGFGESSLNIEIFAYVLTDDYTRFVELREVLLLKIMGTVADHGASFAFPTRTVVVQKR